MEGVGGELGPPVYAAAIKVPGAAIATTTQTHSSGILCLPPLSGSTIIQRKRECGENKLSEGNVMKAG